VEKARTPSGWSGWEHMYRVAGVSSIACRGRDDPVGLVEGVRMDGADGSGGWVERIDARDTHGHESSDASLNAA
jgi:hypothetical protein